MGTIDTTTTNTTSTAGTTNTTTPTIFTTITSTISGWLSNEWLKLGVAGIVGFTTGYVVKMIKG